MRLVTIKYLSLLLVLLAVVGASQFSHLEFFEYCRYLDYPVQDHVIPTDDHYNLRFYRLQAKNTQIVSGKKVVYLQHGLVDSCDTWIVNDEELAIAFVLANRGFDVWVGNSRGNRYSTKQMSPSVLKFWDFTFHEMGVQDLPAAFRYINRVTGRKLHYIGHSQGTLQMFIALAQQVKLVTDNLLSFHAFAPVAYLKQSKSKILSSLAKTDLPNILEKNHVKAILFMGRDGLRMNSVVCKFTPFICAGLLRALSDSNNTVNNMKRMPFIFGHFPSGSSTKNLIHYEQYVNKGEFKMFDYGQKKNMAVYGQKVPPFYDLSKITFPVHLYVGKYDKLGDVDDAQRLYKQLINSVGKTYKIYDFGHATFIWGKSIPHLTDALSVIDGIDG